jgi:GMP synthase (glutamine-hydrolysing)
MFLILDFGSPTTKLIAQRLRDLGAFAKVVTPDAALIEIKKNRPHGLILSGCPLSVYDSGAQTIPKSIFTLGIPILGICYGAILTVSLLGGRITIGNKEVGQATLLLQNTSNPILAGLPPQSTVWMEHRDDIISLPKSFRVVGATAHAPNAFAVDNKRKIFLLLFHPEAAETTYGTQLVKNFLKICSTCP